MVVYTSGRGFDPVDPGVMPVGRHLSLSPHPPFRDLASAYSLVYSVKRAVINVARPLRPD